MSNEPQRISACDPQEIRALIREARAGSGAALGQLIDAYRSYLLSIAAQELSPAIRAKIGASDLVQETSLEAHRDFTHFKGEEREELLAWLRRILLNNAANAGRQFEQTQMRKLSRERPLEPGAEGARLADPGLTPSAQFFAMEKQKRVEYALQQLSPDMRQAILLRNREHLSFAQIGEQMNRSADAARKLWARAVERMHDMLVADESSSGR